MTSKLTREERVQALYDLKVGQVLSMADIENVKMLSRMALAAMDSEPYGYVNQGVYELTGSCALSNDHESYRDTKNYIPLYRHAQQLVVPEEMTIRDACKFVQDMRLFDDVSVIVMRTWNACRAAMLNGGKS